MIYYPRMALQLTVPIWGSSADRKAQNENDGTFTFTCKCSRAELVQNGHNAADELRATVDWLDAGVDPRLLSDAVIALFLSNAAENAPWQPGPDNRRFIGIAKSVNRKSSDSGQEVNLEALDFTTLLIESKPYPPEGVPDYGQTLQEAWERICDYAGGKDVNGAWFRSIEALRGKLDPRGIDNWPPTLSAAGSARVKKGKPIPIPIKPQSDAWAVWQQCCGMLGLITWIAQDVVVVSTATNLFTRENPVRFVFGKNVSSIEETRNCAVAGKKISIVSFDPLTGSKLQVWHPPREVGGKKKTKASKEAGKANDYDVFEYSGVADEGVLQQIAEMVWEEKSRQELEGNLTTSEMFVEGMDGRQADLLRIGAGQNIRVELDQEVMDVLAGIDGDGKRVAYLEAKGYEHSVAVLLAGNQVALGKLVPVFHTKTVRTTLETSDVGGTFEVEIEYMNRIEITGDAA